MNHIKIIIGAILITTLIGLGALQLMYSNTNKPQAELREWASIVAQYSKGLKPQVPQKIFSNPQYNKTAHEIVKVLVAHIPLVPYEQALIQLENMPEFNIFQVSNSELPQITAMVLQQRRASALRLKEWLTEIKINPNNNTIQIETQPGFFRISKPNENQYIDVTREAVKMLEQEIGYKIFLNT